MLEAGNGLLTIKSAPGFGPNLYSCLFDGTDGSTGVHMQDRITCAHGETTMTSPLFLFFTEMTVESRWLPDLGRISLLPASRDA